MKASHACREVYRERVAAPLGFTLLELMVALTVGGIAISSVYAIGAASTRVFRQQHEIANAQTSLRMAMDQVKRDLARAGYLGTPRADMPGQRCGPVDAAIDHPGDGTGGDGRLAAISNFENDVAIAALLDAKNGPHGFKADRIVMFGNYETGAEYPITIDPANADRVIIDQGVYDFRRDFMTWWETPTNPDTEAFQEVFRVGRMVGLRRPMGDRSFDKVLALETAGGVWKVRLAGPIAEACRDVGYIAPLNAIRYDVQTAAGDEAERFANTSGPVTQLVRTEVLPEDKDDPLPSAGDRRAILDYVVAFNLAFQMTADTADGAADNYVVGTATNNQALVSGATGAPERIRAITIELAVRTPEQDPQLFWDTAQCPGASCLCAGLRCFRVFDDPPEQWRPGAARVRSLRAEVFVPNIALEGY